MSRVMQLTLFLVLVQIWLFCILCQFFQYDSVVGKILITVESLSTTSSQTPQEQFRQDSQSASIRICMSIGRTVIHVPCAQRFVRAFHATRVPYGSPLKVKLDLLQKTQTLVKRTEKENGKQRDIARREARKARKYGYSIKKANEILKGRHKITNLDKSIKVGPTSDDDTSILSVANDKRLMYTILGISRPQLKNSILVERDVAKFCKRGQLQKALFLIKLAGPNGAAGMNTLMTHYLEVEKDSHSAVDLYSWRKKWQIPPNEYTETNLFKGLARLPEPISVKVAERVVKIVLKLVEDERLNNINFNAALSALANSNDPSYLFKCFDLRPKGIKKDAIAYTQLLIGCAKITDAVEAIQRADDIMNSADPKVIDSLMFFHYLNVWHSRRDLRFSNCVLPLLDIFYDFKVPNVRFKKEIPEFVKLPALKNWNIKSKMRLTPHVAHLLMENCFKTGQYEYGIAFFEHYLGKRPNLFNNRTINAALNLIIKADPENCGERCYELLRKMMDDGMLREPLQHVVLTYKAFERQATKKLNNSDPVKATELVKSCLALMKDNEAKTSIQNDEYKSYLSWKPWMFLLRIVMSCKDALPLTFKKTIIDEFITTMLCDPVMLLKQRGSTRESMRFVYLEAVRFIKSLESSLNLTDEELKEVQAEAEDSNSLLKRKFLFRRHLIRLRKRILEVVDNLEHDRDSNSPEIEKLFRQYCETILDTNIDDFSPT